VDGDAVDYADVIGPDEYHERVSNNFFTNEMIRHCMESALRLEEIFADQKAWFALLLKEMDYDKDWTLLMAVCGRIRGPQTQNDVIAQFDGFFGLEDCTLDTVRGRLKDPREYWGGDHGVAGTTQIIKQADVIALMALLPERFTREEVAANWAYYEPRTEHGSSLSACMYALTACRTGRTDEAWKLFLRTAMIDVTGEGKQWAGEIYIGGTHPASNGGAWMIAALGFAGLRMHGGEPELHPNLPRQIRRLAFPFTAKGKQWMAEVTQEGYTLRER
jgi:trehalose/maltose hydrolase-like predicted phosphorylase